ncbi:hypothetical protein IMZ48_28070 [Candidatus Bathyarchaeota archaeon]|nr:hypothetical protein [Candidatus Bathyarchaeota archaeon]
MVTFKTIIVILISMLMDIALIGIPNGQGKTPPSPKNNKENSRIIPGEASQGPLIKHREPS